MANKEQLIKRDLILKIIQSKLIKEEQELKEADTEYMKRFASHSIAVLRDIYDMIKNVEIFER